MKLKSCLLAGAALPLVLCASNANAQVGANPVAPPVFDTIDNHGVELLSTHLSVVLTGISIGPGGPGSLSYNAVSNSSQEQQAEDAYGYLTISGTSSNIYSVVLGSTTETFTLSNGVFTQNQGRPSTLVYNSGNNTYTYTDADGTVSVFSYQLSSTNPASSTAKIVSKTFPAGETLNYYYAYNPYVVGGTTTYAYDVQAVTSSLGYQMRFAYAQVNGTQQISSVVLFNMASETCDPAAASCNLVGSWPKLTFSQSSGPTGTTFTITDSLNRPTSVLYGSTAETITYPTGRQVTYQGAVDASGAFAVTSVSDGRGTWFYTHPDPHVTVIYNPDDPNRQAGDFNQMNDEGQLVAVGRGATSPQIYYSYDNQNRVTEVSTTDTTTTSNWVKNVYHYDTYGRIDQVSKVTSQTSQTIPSTIITSSAGYPDLQTCTNLKVCNKPSWTKDANGNQTDYVYNPNNGAVDSMTLPPANPGDPRTQIRYNYATQTASFRDGSGNTISGAPVYRLTSTSQCFNTGLTGSTITRVSCAGASDEFKTTISYGTDQALPTGAVSGPADGTYSTTTAASYYPTGDVKTVDGPVPSSADTTRYYYDTMREITGVIGVDPDGSGALKYRAAKTTYNGEGQPILIEAGTAPGQGDGDMSTFASLQQQAIAYDAQGRARVLRLTVGGTVYQLTQNEYTNAGALSCTAVRMNTSLTDTQLASGCVQTNPSNPTSGTYGADQITQYIYDTKFRVTDVNTGVGVSGDAATEVHNVYGPMGELQSVKDANNNVTTYEYDIFYRLAKTRFPNPTGGGSSTTDFEQLTHDLAGNVTEKTTRAGTGSVTNWTDYVYDGLNRVKTKTPHSGASNPTSTFQYDLMGRMTSAVATTTAHTVTTRFQYGSNAQGPYKTDESLIDSYSAGQKFMQYDVAGRRTQLKWGDGFYVSYDYDFASEVTAIRENGGTVIEAFGYDDLGRRTVRTAPLNGTGAAYGYDGASNLTSLSLSGGGSAVSINPLTYNPAGQIMTRKIDNNNYAWTGAANASVSYSADGQNKYSNISGSVPGYDLKGNLSSTNGVAYTYGIENQLMTANPALPSGGTLTLIYDAFGRLVYNANTARFDYDGDAMVTEAGVTGGLSRRYVFGPAVDEPLVWYEGTGTSTKRYLDADERGSIIRVTDGSGATLAINSYDEYGAPATTSATYGSRFRYTGQAMIPELAMYYYKARFYSSTLGRFVQPDPIGYGGGMNMYNYVGGDPVNAFDPSGLDCTAVGNVGCDLATTTGTITIIGDPNRPVIGDGPLTIDPRDIIFADAPAGPVGNGNPNGAPYRQQISITPQNGPLNCGQAHPVAAAIADWADKISLGSGALAATSAGLGLIAAPTGAGFAALEGVAAVAGLVSTVASGVGVVAHLAEGDKVGAYLDGAGLVGGAVAGRLATRAYAATRTFGDLSASQARGVRFMSGGIGTGIGAGTSLYHCS